MGSQLEFYFESTPKRTFAGALEWLGWCRSGKTEQSALEALVANGPRYKRAIGTVGRGLDLPGKESDYKLAERLEGNATTDFGAPGRAPSYDERPLVPEDVKRLVALMKACWKTLDRAAKAAEGRELKKGPRGGGRELDGILSHVLEAQKGYLSSLGGKFPKQEGEDPALETARLQQAVVQNLKSRAAGKPPERDRAKTLWTPRYFVRRSAWHVLDHAWEIEDRAL